MTTDRTYIKSLVQTRNDFQNNRIRTANRLSLKKDGTNQNKKEANLDISQIPEMKLVLAKAKEMESDLDKMIAKSLKGVPIYENFLKGVKGIGPTVAAVLISQIDIEKATNVSKIWQYAGLNPGMVKGKKNRLVVSKGEHEEGYNIYESYETDEMVCGDRPTKGFVLPYNAFLKKYLLGIMADCMIKSRSPYRDFYDNYKERLKNSRKPIAGKDGKLWCETSDAHRHRAAIRYMVKRFLVDLYVNWRTLEGLEVRPPYEEEYLGIKHHF